MRTRTLLMLVTSLILTAARGAVAQPIAEEPVAIEWTRGSGAESCPDEVQGRWDVLMALGRNPMSSSATRTIQVVISHRDGWSARIDERRGDVLVGSRELSSDEKDCTSIHKASVLVVALLIDPGVPPPLPPPPDPHVPPCPRCSALPPLLSPEPWPRPIFHARAGPSFGILPSPTFALALSAGVEGEWLECSAGLLWLTEGRTGTGAFAFGLTAGWLGACVHPVRFSRGSFAACGALQAGAIHSVVVSLDDFAPVNPGERAWAALSFAPLLRVALVGPLSAETGIELLVPLTRHRYLVGDEAVFSVPAVGLLPFLGLGVSIP